MSAIIAILLVSQSVIAATPTPSIMNGQNGALDTPTSAEKRAAHPPRGVASPDDEWTITCFRYPGYTVKSLEGSGKGDVIVSTQRAGPTAPRCGAQDDPGETVIGGGYLVGARGGFVITEPPEGYDFQIHDAFSGRFLYADSSSFIHQADFSLHDDVLTVAYTRAVVAKCSLLTGGSQCWAQIARDAKLPLEIARMPPPVAACEASYRRFAQDKDSRSGPSLVTYRATITVDRSGHSAVLSRGRPSCEPQP